MGGKRKIEMKKRETKSQRMVAFSKRRKGLFKKADELRRLTGSDNVIVAFSEAGRPYIYGDPSSFHQYFGRNGNVHVQNEEEKEAEDFGRNKEEEAEMRFWLENIQVDDYDDLDQLLLLKDQLERIKLNIVEDEFVSNFLV